MPFSSRHKKIPADNHIYSSSRGIRFRINAQRKIVDLQILQEAHPQADLQKIYLQVQGQEDCSAYLHKQGVYNIPGKELN